MSVEEAVHIQPTFEENAHNLEHLLENRSTADRLVQQNIIKGISAFINAHRAGSRFLLAAGGVGIAPSIQATQQVLKFQKAVDTIDRKLEHRPPKEELIDHNIIKGMSWVLPHLSHLYELRSCGEHGTNIALLTPL